MSPEFEARTSVPSATGEYEVRVIAEADTVEDLDALLLDRARETPVSVNVTSPSGRPLGWRTITEMPGDMDYYGDGVKMVTVEGRTFAVSGATYSVEH